MHPNEHYLHLLEGLNRVYVEKWKAVMWEFRMLSTAHSVLLNLNRINLENV